MTDARSNTPMFKCIGLRKAKVSLLTLRPFFIFSLALIFLINSLGGDLLISEAWAAKASGLPSVGPETAGSPTPLKELNADTFTIPQEFGYIQESAKVPNSSKTVIHIQDAHCNYAAQKSISKILNYLTNEYGVYTVNCEGGTEGYDLSMFTDIPEKDIRERTSDYFVKEGIVNAAEFFAVNNPQKVKLWGVEDADLYVKNLKVYRESLAYKDEVDRYIKSIGYILDNLKRHIYSPETLDFDNNYMKYKNNKLSFKEYIMYLIMTAGKKTINIKSFPNIYLLDQTLEEEDKINFKRANNEKDALVDRLKKVLSRNELEELMVKVGQMKIERISQADFYAYLVKKAKSIKLDLKSYPELEKYIIYIAIYSAIDRTKITKEIDSLEDKIKECLYENDTQRELGILSKNLILEKNMFNISLTRDDYTYYQEHRANFSVINFVRFIDAKAPLYKIQAKLDNNIERLDVYREKMEAFYECSLERDKAFVKNIKFTDHDRPNSIIITGGFHTENLRELFKNENVSYVSIMPKFTNPPEYESPYLRRLAGQKTAIENVIDTAIAAVLNLQAVNILSTEIAVKVEGKAQLELYRFLALMLAALDRNRQFILRIKPFAIEGKRPNEERFITFTRAEGAEGITSSTAQTSSAGFDAELINVEPNSFVYTVNVPQVQVAQAIPAAEGGVSHILPLNPPQEKYPTFMGNLVSNGEPVTTTAGFMITEKDKKLTVAPPGMVGIGVTAIGNISSTDRERLMISLKREIDKPAGELTAAEKEQITALMDKVKATPEIVILEPQQTVKGFFWSNKLYLSRDLITQPLLMVRSEPVAIAIAQAQLMYKTAVEPAVGTASIIRKNTATRILTIVASEEDKALVGSLGQTARDIVGPNTNIHINSYTANDDRSTELKELREKLKIELGEFIKNDLVKIAPLMEIRIKEGKVIREEVEQMIKDILTELRPVEKIEDIMTRIKLVQVRLEPGKHTNPAIEFFADMGMLECYRYINGDFERRDMPRSLEDHFLALLKLSIKNGADFDGMEIDKVLNMIFNGHLLEIKPADFKSFDEWNRANRQLMQSV